MDRDRVESSNIASVGYDPLLFLLEVEFGDGAVYRYDRVPWHIYRGLMDAQSKGSYFARWVREQYPTTKIQDATTSATGS